MKKLILIFCVLSTFLLKAAIVTVPSPYYRVDAVNKIILSNYNLSTLNQNQNSITGITLDKLYNFSQTISSVTLGTKYLVTNSQNGQVYKLFFTQLPIISINTNLTIVDSPKVLAQFTLIETNKPEFSSDIGVEYRGAFSQTYPKKSMEIEFWGTPDGSQTLDYPILGLMNDDSFNLQAMYNEDSRVRSKTANELWLQMSSLSYQSSEPDAKNGIISHYVEVFMNNKYYGLYALGEKVNRKNLKLKKYNGTIRGELYKGSAHTGPNLYSYTPTYNNTSDVWSNFEYKHPKDAINWINLKNFVSFVVDSNQSTFLQGIQSKFEIDNAVDYYIFLNLTRAMDNTGKNLYIAKYDAGGKYFYVPWDLDSTFGYSWDGTVLNIYNDLLTNGMYAKLRNDSSPSNFKNKVSQRWSYLRQNVLSDQNMSTLFDANTNQLLANNVYEREKLVWNFNYQPSTTVYMQGWLQNRVQFLDNLFSGYLSTESNSINDRNFTYYPNPVKNELNIVLSKKEKCSVEIYSAEGKLVLNATISDEKNKIDVSKLTNGNYFVKCKSAASSKEFKIIVAK